VSAVPARILVVDDSPEVREYLEVMLQAVGYTAIAAPDGRAALDLVRSQRPDLIITDVSMPGMSGFELLEHLRSDFAPPLPPVIVVSGFAISADEAVRRGAFSFIPKPFDSHDLLAVVEYALHGQAPDERTLAHEQQYASDARARAAAAAHRLLGDVDLQAAELVGRLTRLVDRIASYFDLGFAVIALVQGGELQVAAVSAGGDIAVGTRFSGDALYSSGVLASGASLVLPDTQAYSFSDRRAAQLGLRFFVAVPLWFESVAIGALTLGDRVPRRFEAEHLVSLESLGRGASQNLRDWIGQPTSGTRATESGGLFSAATFVELLTCELALLNRQGGAIDLVLIDVEPDNERRAVDAIWRVVSPPRTAICRWRDASLAVFQRAAPFAGEIGAAIQTLLAMGALRNAGCVSLLDDGLPSVARDELLNLARGALEHARQGGPGTVERVVLRREAWAPAPPH
jgi:CheY-like chemotaxis protein